MKNQISLTFLAALTLGVFVAGCNAPAGNNEAAPAPSNSTNTTSNGKPASAPPSAQVPFDQQFIDSMVPHHESALMMAKMVETRAQFPEVRALAKAIIADQKKEIAQMKAWRKAWFGSDEIPPMEGHGAMKMDDSAVDHSKMDHSKMDGSGAMSSDVMTMPGTAMGLPITGAMDMKKLREAKGDALDREFLRMMIPHHAGAVTMAQEVLLQSKRPELQKLARQIIAAQAREMGEMEAIARKRFGAL